jgi:nitrogen-specific signal transduction histidine kinase
MDAVQKSVAYLQQLADGLHYLVLDPDDEGAGPTSTDLYAWWEQAGPLLSKAVPKQVEFMVDIATGLPHVALSAHGLTQVMLNLIVNAGEAIGAKQKTELEQAGTRSPCGKDDRYRRAGSSRCH